jgi:uncharacterized tellurite resistance protein B-like protein
MLDRLAKLFRALSGEGSSRPRMVFDEDDHRVAAAALLVHAVNADGVRTDSEMAELEVLLKERFSLDDREVAALIEAADQRNRETLDLGAFTGIVRRSYTPEGRARIVEMMWEIVFADGKLHEFEDNLVWRVADMIGVDRDTRRAIRVRVAAARDIDLADADD